MRAYYNENNRYCAAWLRNLIAAGLIADGDVDERSIVDVRPGDLVGYTQCHFFAGIGGWSLGFRLAGWPDDRPVWSASVPCQPYSFASVAHGGAKGVSDGRDLWPIFFPLACELTPATIFGEQVSGAIEWGWWDRTALDLEVAGYAAATLLLRADAAGAGHERKRLYWVANAGGEGWEGHQPVGSIFVRSPTALALYGDPLAASRIALAGDYSRVLPRDGVPVGVERLRAHGYGNAIVPQVAAEFIGAYLDVTSGRESVTPTDAGGGDG